MEKIPGRPIPYVFFTHRLLEPQLKATEKENIRMSNCCYYNSQNVLSPIDSPVLIASSSLRRYSGSDPIHVWPDSR